jgi:hypothetical protein
MLGILPADEGPGSQKKDDLVNKNCGQRVKGVVDDPAADNGGNSAKHQDSELSSDIHDPISLLAGFSFNY